MSKEYKMPELNTIQEKQILQHLADKTNFDRKKDMDDIAQQITEVLMLNGFSNSESSYVLINVQRHLLSLENNRKQLEQLGVKVDDLNIDTLGFIMGVHAKEYRKSVDKNGKPKY